MSKKKVLLMGRQGCGKTSMRSIIFANFVARDTMRFVATNSVEHVDVRFLGNLVLNLWDCGGQLKYYATYFEDETMFRNVEVLIYVFDIDSVDLSDDLNLFAGVMEAVERSSPDASVFVLIHKMDLINEEERDKMFRERAALVQSRTNFKIKAFGTSIWDETLYKAWSQIVYSLIPNIDQLESQLKEFGSICGADEVVLFEKETFLVISHASTFREDQYDDHRFERISNIIKQFKISCFKTNSQFQAMEVGNAHFTAYIDVFTRNTYIMIIKTGTGRNITAAVLQLNLAAARPHFENFIPGNA